MPVIKYSWFRWFCLLLEKKFLGKDTENHLLVDNQCAIVYVSVALRQLHMVVFGFII